MINIEFLIWEFVGWNC